MPKATFQTTPRVWWAPSTWITEAWYLHFECGTYLYRTPALQALKADVMDTLAKSREISPGLDRRRHFWSRMLDAVLRIAAPLC